MSKEKYRKTCPVLYFEGNFDDLLKFIDNVIITYSPGISLEAVKEEFRAIGGRLGKMIKEYEDDILKKIIIIEELNSQNK